MPKITQPWKMWLIFYYTGSKSERHFTVTELCEMLKAAHGDNIMPRIQASK
jgi:hypothetical protein